MDKAYTGGQDATWRECTVHGQEVLPLTKAVCDLYIALTCKGNTEEQHEIVVFDGYIEMSAKRAITQQRRASGKVASTVTLTDSMSNFEEG